jgi:anaerobic magnesium-protoporphyrin IX monomethyl ester cyclase
MRVILIYPPPVRVRYNISGIYPTPPLGLACIAAVLEKNNFSVQILDMPALKINFKRLEDYLKNNFYSVYGLSCDIFNLKQGFKIARLIKGINPNAKVILGGNCTIFPAKVILRLEKDIDIIVNNEGEEAMLKICGKYKDGHSLGSFKEIPGIAYRHKGREVVTEDGPFLDLDQLPFPSRGLLPNKYYRMHPPFNLYPPITFMETSRGCPYKCSFCSISRQLRERSEDSVIDEVKEVTGKFKVKEIYFVDPVFTYNQQRIINICNKILAHNIDIHWSCRTRVDLVSKDLLKIMSKAGCYSISYGVESGSQESLDQFNKNIRVNDIENAFRWSRDAKIRTIAYILFNPSLTDNAEITKTMDLIKVINPDFALFSKLLLKPHSDITEQLMSEGKLSYQELIKFYTGGHRSRGNKSVFRFYLGFYFNIKYVCYRLKNLKNARDLINLATGVFFLIRDRIKAEGIFEI